MLITPLSSYWVFLADSKRNRKMWPGIVELLETEGGQTFMWSPLWINEILPTNRVLKNESYVNIRTHNLCIEEPSSRLSWLHVMQDTINGNKSHVCVTDLLGVLQLLAFLRRHHQPTFFHAIVTETGSKRLMTMLKRAYDKTGETSAPKEPKGCGSHIYCFTNLL